MNMKSHGSPRKSLIVGDPYVRVQPTSYSSSEGRIRQELLALGASKIALNSMEARHLPSVIHANEHIGGMVYGHHEDGMAMLVATDKRIIFIDKKPLFVNEDEITYDVVSGVRFSHAGFGSTVALHTRAKDYTFKTLNQICARGFVEYIELRCLEHDRERRAYYD